VHKVNSNYSVLNFKLIVLGQRLNGIPATVREAGPEDTPELLEAERQNAQEFIDNGDLVPVPVLFFSLISCILFQPRSLVS
jgi:hypothetical protein